MCGAGKVEYSPWGVHVQWCVQETWASVRLQEVTADWLSSEWEHTQYAGGRRITNLSQLGTRSQIKSLSAFQRERVVLVVRESLECRREMWWGSEMAWWDPVESWTMDGVHCSSLIKSQQSSSQYQLRYEHWESGQVIDPHPQRDRPWEQQGGPLHSQPQHVALPEDGG